MNDDVNINIKNFKLEDLSQIIEKDSSLLKGDVNGNVLLKRVNNAYGIIADAGIDNLYLFNKPIGNLTLNAQNPTTKRFDLLATLSGADNQLNAKGFFVPNGGENSLNINADIQSLSMKTVEAFSMGQISEASGFVNGNFSITGSTTVPEIKGVIMSPSFIKKSGLKSPM
jgi:autotransporter translocation and assembly factor TamB